MQSALLLQCLYAPLSARWLAPRERPASRPTRDDAHARSALCRSLVAFVAVPSDLEPPLDRSRVGALERMVNLVMRVEESSFRRTAISSSSFAIKI